MMPFASKTSGSLFPVELHRVPGSPSNAWYAGNPPCSDDAETGVDPHESDVHAAGLTRIRWDVVFVSSPSVPDVGADAEQWVAISPKPAIARPLVYRWL